LALPPKSWWRWLGYITSAGQRQGCWIDGVGFGVGFIENRRRSLVACLLPLNYTRMVNPVDLKQDFLLSS
jgi:hypothetical protein